MNTYSSYQPKSYPFLNVACAVLFVHLLKNSQEIYNPFCIVNKENSKLNYLLSKKPDKG